MGSSRRPLAIALGLATLAAALPVKAEELRPVGVVTTLTGTATIKRALADARPLRRLDDVYLADRLTTGDDSLARILLGGKALITVRERSVLTITEVPGMATVKVGPGGVALAVVKERMKSGESIEIRTPNAVAAVRGTVVIAEVAQMTSQAGAAAAAFTTTFTVVRGLVEVRSLDPLTGHAVGPSVSLGALHSLRITGAVAPGRPEALAPEAGQRLNNDYKISVPEAPPAASAAVVQEQVRGAANLAVTVSGSNGAPGHPGGSDVKGVSKARSGEPSGGGSASGKKAGASATPAVAAPVKAPQVSAPVVTAPAVSAATAPPAASVAAPTAPSPAAVADDSAKRGRPAHAGGKKPKK